MSPNICMFIYSLMKKKSFQTGIIVIALKCTFIKSYFNILTNETHQKVDIIFQSCIIPNMAVY